MTSSATPLVTIKDLVFTYPGKDFPTLDKVSLNIEERDTIACIGPNGAGKTTLAKIILGLLNPNSGTLDLNLKRTDIGYTPQSYHVGKNFPGTVEEILTNGSALIGNEYSQKPQGIQTIISNLEPFLKKKFTDLSGGQQQRVLITLALGNNPRLLILDEPISGVDIPSRQSFYQMLSELNREGIAILMITHDTLFPTAVNRVLYLDHHGYFGTPEEVKPILAKQGVDLQFASDNTDNPRIKTS